MEMVAHQVAGDAAEGFLDAGDLRDDVGAVAILFDHFLEAAHLAFDTAEALEISVFQLRIDGDGFAALGCDGAGAVGRCGVLGSGACWNLGRHLYPPGLYIPYGAIGCQTKEPRYGCTKKREGKGRR